MLDSDTSAVVRPRASEIGRRLIDVDERSLDILDKIAADSIAWGELEMSYLDPRIHCGMFVNPAPNRVRPRDDRITFCPMGLDDSQSRC